MRQSFKWLASISLGLTVTVSASAAAPSGYYSTCEGKKGAALLSALCDKIGSHTDVGYDGLWNVYKTSDVRANGKVWDMYSTKEWTVGQEHCGNYSYVGDCINREHSMPKSWFSEGSPMKSDAFHVYPTDGKVNGQRSNYPYGECAGGTTLPSHGSVQALGRLGSSTFPGYTGKVFEPDDEYKGDFARTYFYMAACYNTKIKGWSSDMLAGNSYPAFKQWAIDLLLKWHRQDPVSPKETARNEAVYAYQHNRNPFIDYPDMVEHIWGDATSTGWSSTGTPRASIATPVSGSTIDMGMCGKGVVRSHVIVVKGSNLTAAVSVSVSGAGFSASATSLAASAVNSADGASLTLSYLGTAATVSAGTLTLRSGDAISTVALKATAVDGIPALDPQNVSEVSFDARWVSIDPAGADYQLHVTQGGTALQGYPVTVSAAAERHTVTSLTPGTTYIYWLASPAGLTSNRVEVTTAIPVPSIQYLFDGDLYFTCEPGVPSEVAELLIDTENIDAPIVVTVSAPFELSSDKQHWTVSLPLADEQDRFYLRLNAAAAGSYSTPLVATAGDYVYDDITVEGVCASVPTFLETFEEPSSLSSYNGGLYQGSACAWTFTRALVGADARDRHSGGQGARLSNKTGETSGIAMAEPRMHGIGRVSFMAKAWSGEEGDLSLEVSTDGGLTWNTVRTFAVGSEAWTECTAAVNETGTARIRIMRLSGKRISIDDVEMTDYAVSAVAELDYHGWDAYCLNGELVIENGSQHPVDVAVTSVSGAVWHSGILRHGSMSLDLPQGVYMVTSGGFSRKVVVK